MIPAIHPPRLAGVWQSIRGKSLPHQCPVCRLSLSADHTLCCDACWDKHHQAYGCQCCGLPVLTPQTHCGQCLSHPPAWHTLTAISAYLDPLPDLVHRFKYQGDFELALPFATLLSEKIDTPAPVLLPVPLHWRRRLQRGFNQSAHLAWALQQRLDSQVVNHYLRRTRHTSPQQGLDRSARLKNLRGAFRLHGALPAEHVALVDDVVTTGETVSQLCRLLRRAGAKRVDIYCIARTKLP